MQSSGRRLTLGELQQIDSLISLAQERGLDLGDEVKVQSEICCCGAIAATAHGNIVFPERDQEIIRQIAALESQIDYAPTLGQLIEARAALLREAEGSQ
ncbi:MAG: hypothetical protein IT338_08615 [Thermomicrobiales bacterium]|nr:hypothetical protein [Thermomicrobiales bacterium]